MCTVLFSKVIHRGEGWGRTPEEVLPAKRSSYAGAASVGMGFVPMFVSVS